MMFSDVTDIFLQLPESEAEFVLGAYHKAETVQQGVIACSGVKPQVLAVFQRIVLGNCRELVVSGKNTILVLIHLSVTQLHVKAIAGGILQPEGIGESLCKAILGEIPFHQGEITLRTRALYVGFCDQTTFLLMELPRKTL